MSVIPVELYTDGACKDNPGPGGIAYVVRYWELTEGNDVPQVQQFELSQGYVKTTNNRMEVLAGIKGLEYILNGINTGTFKNVSAINIATDSKYFADAIIRRWIESWQRNNWVTSLQTPVKNKDLWEMFLNVRNSFSNMGIVINIEHIPGHNGHPFNELADKLAVSARNGTNLITDEMYEKQSKR